MVSLLQRACAGLSGPTTEQPVESETLSMAMGLVATLLSEPQVTTAAATATTASLVESRSYLYLFVTVITTVIYCLTHL